MIFSLIVALRFSKFVERRNLVTLETRDLLNWEVSSVKETHLSDVVSLFVFELIKWLRNLGNDVGRKIMVVPLIGNILNSLFVTGCISVTGSIGVGTIGVVNSIVVGVEGSPFGCFFPKTK